MLYEAHVQAYRRRRAERLWARYEASEVWPLRAGWRRAYLAEAAEVIEMMNRRA